MGNEIIEKKSEQIHSLLLELKEWTDVDFEVFDKTVTLIRSCERNIELLVELASDINANIILQKQGKTPDSYKDSFQRLEKIGILQGGVCKKLIDSVKLRNGLVHEYEFDLDNRKLYDSIKKDFIPAYGEYLKSVLNRTK
ncbi:MAG: DUF86 domain-containing protein [Patescibacteria group bacterium]